MLAHLKSFFFGKNNTGIIDAGSTADIRMLLALLVFLAILVLLTLLALLAILALLKLLTLLTLLALLTPLALTPEFIYHDDQRDVL